MTVAWVITREGPRHPTEVIGILSKRKSVRIKEYVEWFCALLHYTPGEHLTFSRYNNPTVPHKAHLEKQDMVWCEDLIAVLGRNISLIKSCEKEPFLEWTNPNGVICEAPIHLPLRIMSEDTALKRGGVTDTEAVKKADAPPPFDLEKVVLGAIKLRNQRSKKSTCGR
jgi:hypothetical protein